MNNITILLISLLLIFTTKVFATDSSIQDQLNKQTQIIEEQNKRIEHLEKIIKSLMLQDDQNNDVASEATTKANINNDDNQGDIAASSKGKIYNPEKAFFGPLPQLRSNDGRYSAGLMGLVQLDSALYDHEPRLV